MFIPFPLVDDRLSNSCVISLSLSVSLSLSFMLHALYLGSSLAAYRMVHVALPFCLNIGGQLGISVQLPSNFFARNAETSGSFPCWGWGGAKGG